MVITVKWGKEGVGKGAAGLVGVVIYAVKVYLAGGLMLKKKVLPLMIGWVVCNFKPFRGHTFMTATKNF